LKLEQSFEPFMRFVDVAEIDADAELDTALLIG
jgi:hypothetical protein